MMALNIKRILDCIYVLWLSVHLLISATDFELVVFGKYYPQWLQNFMVRYTTAFKDVNVFNLPGWLHALILIELLFLVPFMFAGIYAFGKGYRSCPWIRVPAIMYAASLITMGLAIIGEYMLTDFTGHKQVGPSTLNERLRVSAVYSVFVIMPAIILIDMLFFRGSRTEHAVKSTTASKKKGSSKKVN